MSDEERHASQSSPAIEQLLRVAEARAQELEPFVQEFAQLRQVISLLRDPNGPQQIPHLDVLSGQVPADRDSTLADAGASVGHSVGGELPGHAGGYAMPVFKGRRGTRPGRDGRAPQGSNKQLIMATIADEPGINARRIAELTHIKRSVINATVSRLKRQGELRTVDGGLQISPDTLRPTTAAPETPQRAADPVTAAQSAQRIADLVDAQTGHVAASGR
jgi:hypothetical protein